MSKRKATSSSKKSSIKKSIPRGDEEYAYIYKEPLRPPLPAAASFEGLPIPLLFTRIDFTLFSLFRQSYERIIQMNGLKTIQCFPSCDYKDNHVEGGWCGQEINGLLQCISTAPMNWEDMILIGEFHPASSSNPFSKTHYAYYQQVINRMKNSNDPRYSNLMAQHLIKINIKNVKVDFKMTEQGPQWISKVTFNINPEKQAWNYQWQSSRWNETRRHVLDITLAYKPPDNPYIYILASSFSPQFTIITRKQDDK